VDFGCHRGTFLTGMAALHPDVRFLGIERQAARVERCLQKIARLGLSNAHAVQGESTDSLRSLLPDSSVSRLHISFPDPWPKRRHADRRLVKPDFLREVRRILRPDGCLRLMTDNEAYFFEMLEATAVGWEEIPWDDGRPVVRTTFEQTFLSLGLQPFRRAIRPVSES